LHEEKCRKGVRGWIDLCEEREVIDRTVPEPEDTQDNCSDSPAQNAAFPNGRQSDKAQSIGYDLCWPDRPIVRSKHREKVVSREG
jgi:hypothetical protein